MVDHRERLPNRRHTHTTNMSYLGRSYHVSVGIYPDGRVGEVFSHGAKLGTELDGLIDDACVLLSLLLQNGYPPATLAASMGTDEFGGPASVVGALLGVTEQEALRHASGAEQAGTTDD